MAPRLLFVVVAWLVLVSPSQAEACSCMAPGPPCQATWETETIFHARVLSVTAVDSRNFLSARRVRMRVLEAFRGIDSAEVDVFTGGGGGDCGYEFEQDGEYLVYADRSGERLSAGICSRTRSIDDAAEDLAYLRAVPDRRGGEIVGTALHIEPSTRTRPGTQRPVPGVRVSMTSDRASGEAVSDENGKFTIAGLTAGLYDAHVDAPDGSYGEVHTLAGTNRVRLRDVRGCAEADVVLMHDGRIRGKVVLANGAPASHVFVEAVAEEDLANPGLSRWSVLTDATGAFEIAQLPPARYVVGLHVTRPFQGPSLPRVFIAEPDKPLWERPFAVRAGERIVVPELVVPPTLSFTTVEGVVVGTDGQPSADATVYLHLPRLQGVRLGEPVRVDSEGAFRFGVLRGYQYSIEASRNVPRGEAMVRGEGANQRFDVPLDGQPPVLQLTLRPIAP